ncbi:MAG: hypothetical protein ACOX6L_02970 [Syntrophomonadaceae bacterium]|jgi:hypothetical protein
MKIYIAIDDTDNLEIGATGQTANDLIKMIENNQWGNCQAVTRHQLLLHPDIPYTSHNSSMCFIAEIKPEYLNDLIAEAGNLLQRESAPGSDPGLCIVIEEQVLVRGQMHILVEFGYKVKEKVITKQEAYDLARQIDVHLSEHGGNGLGVIGALAAVGLRMTNNDGRFQGRLKLEAPEGLISVAGIKSNSQVERVQSLDGYLLQDDEQVRLGEKLKTVLLEGKRTLLVYSEGNDKSEWKTCTNTQLKDY